jgi:cyclophilin family peptidyl-prolyl cis-trans isomerase
MPVRLFLLCGVLIACGESGGDRATDAQSAPDAKAAAHPIVVMETTMGTLRVQLDREHEPITTANFLHYVDEHFYDGTLVHRVIDGWVIQGGGYVPGLVPKPADAPAIPLEVNPADSHVNGAISMARTADPGSATTQWFLVDWPKTGTPPQPAQLDGRYAAFGVLTQGFDVLDAISQVATSSRGGLDNVPVMDVVVTHMYQP